MWTKYFWGGLTWSQFLHSVNWPEWSPPSRCDDQSDGSLSGCSGSAVPSPTPSDFFLLGDKISGRVRSPQDTCLLHTLLLLTITWIQKHKDLPSVMVSKTRRTSREPMGILPLVIFIFRKQSNFLQQMFSVLLMFDRFFATFLLSA